MQECNTPCKVHVGPGDDPRPSGRYAYGAAGMPRPCARRRLVASYQTCELAALADSHTLLVYSSSPRAGLLRIACPRDGHTRAGIAGRPTPPTRSAGPGASVACPSPKYMTRPHPVPPPRAPTYTDLLILLLSRQRTADGRVLLCGARPDGVGAGGAAPLQL